MNKEFIDLCCEIKDLLDKKDLKYYIIPEYNKILDHYTIDYWCYSNNGKLDRLFLVRTYLRKFKDGENVSYFASTEIARLSDGLNNDFYEGEDDNYSVDDLTGLSNYIDFYLSLYKEHYDECFLSVGHNYLYYPIKNIDELEIKSQESKKFDFRTFFDK